MRHRRDEVALQLLDGALLGQVAEGVDGAVRELRRRQREPELAAAALDRERLRPLDLAERPAGEDAARRRPDDLVLLDARDPGGSGVPEQDHVVAPDEEDAVADELERLRGLGTAAQLADEMRVLHGNPGAPCELLRQIQVVLVEAVGDPRAEREDPDRLPARDDGDDHQRPRADPLEGRPLGAEALELLEVVVRDRSQQQRLRGAVRVRKPPAALAERERRRQ